MANIIDTINIRNDESLSDALVTAGFGSVFLYLTTQILFIAFVGEITITISPLRIEALLALPTVKLTYLLMTIVTLTLMFSVFTLLLFVELSEPFIREMQRYYEIHNE